MSDDVKPPADLAMKVAIATALTHLVERLAGGGPPTPARIVETRQIPRRPGQANRDHRGRFLPRR